jgi:hypothetical protein
MWRANFWKTHAEYPNSLYQEQNAKHVMLLNDTDSTKGYGYGYGYNMKP